MRDHISPKENKSTTKFLVGNVLLIVASLIFTLLVGEGVSRYMATAWPFQPEIKENVYLTEKDRSLRWRFSPQEGRNSLGLRNREITEKEDNDFRILFLGDSLFWTSETSKKKLYTEVVEDNLNNGLDTDKNIEVINAGIPGYTTYQELEFLNIYGMDMRPDLVILGFVFNDVYYKYLHRPIEGQILATDPEVYLNRFNPREFPGTIFRRSYLAHNVAYVFQRISNKLTSFPYYNFDHRSDFHLAWKSYGWADTEVLVKKMHHQLSDRNIPLVIAIFPVSEQVGEKHLDGSNDYLLYPQSRIKGISKKYDIPYIDFTDVLHQRGGKKLFSDYLHLNKEGNDIVAVQFTQYLFDKLPAYLKKKN